jgi:hypothetical protein
VLTVIIKILIIMKILIKIKLVKTVRIIIIIKTVYLTHNFLEIFRNLLSSGRNKEERKKINSTARKII